MTFAVVVQETAVRALARIRAEDKEAFASIGRALTALAGQPHPPRAVAWGGSGIYRIVRPEPHGHRGTLKHHHRLGQRLNRAALDGQR